MKQLLSILLFFFVFVSCSSDDDNTEPEVEKIQVTEQDIIGSWEYVTQSNGKEVIHTVTFNPSDSESLYTIKTGGYVSKFRLFYYTISELKMTLKGGAIIGDSSETEIYRQGDNLFFLDMPFSLINE